VGAIIFVASWPAALANRAPFGHAPSAASRTSVRVDLALREHLEGAQEPI
jgi:hypothetical protein